ncbi:flagellar export chaperone FliS [Clostridium sp. 'White wine YQ']|uniref:flagellar export chaperone FliS n=1 Tax=Clostridium sp. 'White wine YQ' TaxID=3027474 RepID=UPI002366CD6F|nr:flagellar export chaperone FliS [Clostridium sp. 'White wine YQ']MDD7794627.1 flagellar export chaperone FliS [Clostridium sp. 'White wine YQ']
MYPNALNVYKNNSVNYASKEQLLLMLVDGAVKFSKQSKEAIDNKNIKLSHEYLTRTQDIFTELMISLDRNAGNWAEDMFKIYEFVKNELAEINLKKDSKKLDKLIPLIENIQDTWHTAYKLSKENR